ncbi:MAG: RNA methyltransferase [Gammaproteobacteria bacterium]|jgi:TrmH family RNA methyltransferase|nr:RNA methyltransferase [Gammaproteobacteria bacterium]MBT4607053.1 RNA methyltransferase [Thiotrichales bacterium]MBT3473259.1 RNA methyltransferase [Gammaproteobacteria bacterium]MBT3966445.1 RNA methyltransferase [Gammaproteobacteria bacterium]MBT4081687.1 RNA methyltransferase [Gammaproteobacteria bacterium]
MDSVDVKFVLVETSHPGNIGGAARAMKNMCLDQLALVNPNRYPSADATSRASGADDILMNAGIHETVDQALEGCAFVMGTSARPRGLYIPELTPKQCAERILAESTQGKVAVLFGREDSGLTNGELDRCNALMRIPTSQEYSSLNLAAAVQVLSYELMIQRGEAPLQRPIGEGERRHPLANADEMEGLFNHIEESIIATGFLDPENPRQVMRRLRRLFNRADVDRNEVNILRGILTSVQETVRKV